MLNGNEHKVKIIGADCIRLRIKNHPIVEFLIKSSVQGDLAASLVPRLFIAHKIHSRNRVIRIHDRLISSPPAEITGDQTNIISFNRHGRSGNHTGTVIRCFIIEVRSNGNHSCNGNGRRCPAVQ